MKTITIPETRHDILRSLLKTRPAQLLHDDQVKGFLLPPEQYEAVIELLEDIQDLRPREGGGHRQSRSKEGTHLQATLTHQL